MAKARTGSNGSVTGTARAVGSQPPPISRRLGVSGDDRREIEAAIERINAALDER